MENAQPPILTAVREIRWAIASGFSVNEAVRLYLENATGAFSSRFRAWWILNTQSPAAPAPDPKENFWTKQLFELLQRGRSGQPILEALKGLEQELEIKAEAELDAFIAGLPFKVLIPLLLFQFPAYLILLLGPLLRELERGFAG